MLTHNTICSKNDDTDYDLEDKMELRMERDGQKVTLNLKKNINVKDDVPVYTSKNNVVRKVDTTAMPVTTIKQYIIILWISLFRNVALSQ